MTPLLPFPSNHFPISPFPQPSYAYKLKGICHVLLIVISYLTTCDEKVNIVFEFQTKISANLGKWGNPTRETPILGSRGAIPIIPQDSVKEELWGILGVFWGNFGADSDI